MRRLGKMNGINGVMLVAFSAAITAVMGAIGSSIGIRRTTAHAGGALSEKPELFGKMLVAMALPGTQGFYAFVVMFLMLQFFGFIAGTPKASLAQGIVMLLVGILIGFVEFKTALDQAHSAISAIDLTAKRPEESGRAILLPALVETYAILGLLSGVLLSLWVSKAVF
jgi:V/A-type H+-transporting ATPase subunit K